MRFALVAVTALLLLTAGCVGNKTTSDQTSPSLHLAQHPGLPAPIHQTGSAQAQADVENQAGQPICSQSTSTCVHIKFTSNGTANVTATLKWMHAPDDFDLYLYQGGTLVSSDGINMSGSTNPNDYIATTQVMHASVAAGDYEFIVVPFLVTQDSWIFDATFS